MRRFPHSEICGSMDICSLPQLIAAYHVFRRLSVPRHPPCALSSLILSNVPCRTEHWVGYLLSNALVKTRLILFLSFHCAVFKVREFSFISPLFTEKLEPQSDPSKRYSQELSNSLVSLNVLASLCCLVRHSILTNHSSSRPSFDAASTFHLVLRST